jgi:hypothetical protein
MHPYEGIPKDQSELKLNYPGNLQCSFLTPYFVFLNEKFYHLGYNAMRSSESDYTALHPRRP